MTPLVKHPHQHEEGSRGDAVAEHLIDGAFHGFRPEHENPQHAESQMGDGGISHEFLQVGLHHGHQRAVNDSHDGQDANDGGKLSRRIGEQRQAEAQHAVGSHFKQNARQDDGARRGRLNVRIGQPGVEGEEGNLDGKSDEEGQKEPAFRLRRKRGKRHQVVQHSRQVKAAGDVVEVDDSGEHQGRADHGEQDKLDGRIHAALVTPDADQEIHGNQHHFPKYEEEDQIERGKYPHHSCFQGQQEDEELLRPMVMLFQETSTESGRQKSRQQDHQRAEAVDSQMVIDGG